MTPPAAAPTSNESISSETLALEARVALQAIEESSLGEPRTSASPRPPRALGIPWHLGIRGVSWWFSKSAEDAPHLRAEELAFEFEQIAGALRRGERVDPRLLTLVDDAWSRWQKVDRPRGARVALIGALDLATTVPLPSPWCEYPRDERDRLRAEIARLVFGKFVPAQAAKLNSNSLLTAVKVWARKGRRAAGSPEVKKWDQFGALLAELGDAVDPEQAEKDARHFRRLYVERTRGRR